MMFRGLFVILAAMVLAGNAGAVEWFRSSAGGTLGSPLGTNGPITEGWSLSVDHGDEKETRILYLDGALYSSTVFYRNNGRLTAREELDAGSELISRVEYAYDMDGTPRAVSISLDNESHSLPYIESDSNINPDGKLHRHSSGSGGDWRITDLDSSGDPVSLIVLDSGETVEESLWLRNQEGTLREEIHRTGNEEHRKRFDSDGRLLGETTLRNDLVVLERSYLWSDENLIRVEERGDGRMLVREMEWSEGRIIFESRSENGVVSSQTRWTSPEERTETLFRDGKAVIRIFWTGDIRQKEEFLRDGEVIRIREGGV